MKFINKKIALGVFTVATLFAQSCKKDYLDTTPTNKVNQSVVYDTVAGTASAVQGLHRLMYLYDDSQGRFGLASLYINMDFMGEDVPLVHNGTSWFTGAYRWTEFRTATSGDLRGYYLYFYRIIRNANTILENTEQNKDNVLYIPLRGQAYFYRAFAHYMLVQLYGKRYDAATNDAPNSGIVISLKNDYVKKPRNTVSEVYTQVLADLAAAETNLATFTRKQKDEININVLNGVKARVALTMGRWTDAVKFAKSAQTGYSFMTTSDYEAGFNNWSNVEWMWASNQIQEQVDNHFATFNAYMSLDFSSGHVRSSPKRINKLLYDAFPSTDVRKKNFAATKDEFKSLLPTSPSFTTSQYQNKKFRTLGMNLGGSSICHMRYAEMVLIEAEALARSGNDADAIVALDKLIKARDASYTSTAKSGQSLIDFILLNRRMELWGEGFRFLDLKRLNLPLARTTAQGHTANLTGNLFDVPAGDKQWQFLIPQAEMNASGELMVQNEL